MKTLEPTEPLQERSFHTTFLFVMRKTYLMELNQHNQHLFGKKKNQPTYEYLHKLFHFPFHFNYYVYPPNGTIQYTSGATSNMTIILIEETYSGMEKYLPYCNIP